MAEKKKKRILHKFRLSEISGVDRMAQEGAKLVIIKRADEVEKYSEGQARDEGGRFAGEGGSSSPSSSGRRDYAVMQQGVHDFLRDQKIKAKVTQSIDQMKIKVTDIPSLFGSYGHDLSDMDTNERDDELQNIADELKQLPGVSDARYYNSGEVIVVDLGKMDKYSEDQERDEGGRFAGEGGSGEALDKSDSPVVTAIHKYLKYSPDQDRDDYGRFAEMGGSVIPDGSRRGPGGSSISARGHEKRTDYTLGSRVLYRSRSNGRLYRGIVAGFGSAVGGREEIDVTFRSHNAPSEAKMNDKVWYVSASTGQIFKVLSQPAIDAITKYLKYSEDQERDEQGRFAGEGGGGESNPRRTSFEVPVSISRQGQTERAARIATHKEIKHILGRLPSSMKIKSIEVAEVDDDEIPTTVLVELDGDEKDISQIDHDMNG